MSRRTLARIIAAVALVVVCFPSSAGAAPTLYATGSGRNGALSGLYTIDPLTGVATYVTDIPGVHVYGGGLAYDASTDTLYATGVDNASTGVSRLFTIDRVTGAATAFPGIDTAFNLSFGGLAIHPLTGVLYATGTNGFQNTGLFTIDKTTGAATLVAQTGGQFTALYGLGFRSDGVLFANGYLNYAVLFTSSLMTVDLTTGAVTEIGPHGVTLGRQLAYSGLAFGDDGTLLSLGSIDGSTAGLFSLNTTTGAATLIGSTVLATGVDGGLTFVTDRSLDTTPPLITSIAPSTATLWPPNHKMVAVTFAVTATDAVDPSVSCEIVGVASNEPVNGLGDGDAAPDWWFSGLVAQLRSERGGGGNGRVYRVTVRCTDAAGNSSDATTTVSVPKSLGR